MAKTIQTRIKNKVDSLAAWQAYSGTLLDGEIAIVRVPTGDSYTNPVTGKSEPITELLMKVGDGATAFANLPWLSAKASDVYNWAKVQDPSTIEVTYNGSKATLSTVLKDLRAAEANISGLTTNLSNVRSQFSVDPASATTDGVVQGITYSSSTGKFTVSYGTVAAGDIASNAVTTAKIKDANVTTAKIADANVTTAKIADGNVTNAKIAAGVSSDKISIDADTTLTEKLGTMDAAITANTGKLAGHTDAAINTLIDNKINALDVSEPSASGTSTSFIKTAKQENGKIVVTKANLPTASSSAAGITKLYTSVGTSTDGTVTRKVVNDINTQVQTNKADITNLKTAVAGGVHFRGTVTAAPSASTTTVGDITIAAGDVVIYSGKEYICTAVTDGVPSWEQLGDVTRIGNLETKINGLDVTATNDVATTHKFVSQVTQTDGKVSVTYARPSASDISYGSSSDVNTKLSSIDAAIATKANAADVYNKTETGTQISNAINALDFTAPSASGTTTSFIDSVSQTNGKISATKKTITSASTSAAGIVKLSSSTSSTSESLAATPKAVKTAYDKAVEAEADAAAVGTRVGTIEGNYVRFVANSTETPTVGKFYVGASDTTEMIIFDCGGAE